jgi:hypothetical protein
MLTISKLRPWSINYYIDTAQAAEHAARDLPRAASLTNTDGPARHGIRDHSPVVTRRWMIDQRPSAIAVTSVLLARFVGIAQPLRSRRSGGR